MPPSLVWQLGWIAALCIGAVSLAWLFRRAGVPGSGALAGLLIGLLLGPGIAGRLVPALFEEHLVGGVREREAYEHARAAADGALTAAGHFNATISMEEYERLVTSARSAYATWMEAQHERQQPVRWFTIALATAFALVAARLQRPNRLALRWSISAFSIGLWSSLFTGGVTAVSLVWIGYEQTHALIAGSVVGTGSLFLDPRDVRTAREVERAGAAMMLAAARIATLVAGGALIVILLRADSAGAAAGVVVAAALVGAIMPELKWRIAQRGVLAVVFPWLMALAAARIEVFAHFALGTTIVLVVLSGDGRWFSSLVGAWSAGGRQLHRAMRLVIPVMSAGPMQAALVAAILHTRDLPEAIGFALLLGVCYLESSAPFRRAMARAMVKVENELAEDAPDE